MKPPAGKFYFAGDQRIRELDLRDALETTFTEERFFAARECCRTDASFRGVVFFGFFMIYMGNPFS